VEEIPKATCSLWNKRVLFAGNAGNVTGRRNGPNPPPGSKGSKTKVRPAKPDAKLVKLEATAMAEELKARIRAAKMMTQGVSYSQVVQAQAPLYVAPAPPQPCHALSGLLSLRTKQSRYTWKLSSGCKYDKSPKTSSNHLYNLRGGHEDGNKLNP
jgi:hypothetical protein